MQKSLDVLTGKVAVLFLLIFITIELDVQQWGR